jgi:dihydropteroate synthase
VVVGILNLTPDSFSDGGRWTSVEAALDQTRRMKEAGAGLVDIGGESTRPGAEPVSPEEELHRVLPFLEKAVESGLGPFSIDTRHSQVAREALRAGAAVVNDVSGLKHDPGLASVVAEAGAGVILSHMRGTPATMTNLTDYDDLMGDIVRELSESLALALEAGIPEDRIVLDPGIGFAKNGAQNLLLLRELDVLLSLMRPLMVGPSRKRFIGEITGAEPMDRMPGTLAACVLAYAGGARLFRVHDVGPIVQALAVARAVLDAKG